MGGHSSDSDADRQKRNKKLSRRGKRSRSRSSSSDNSKASSSTSSSRRHKGDSRVKHSYRSREPRRRRSRSRSRDRKDASSRDKKYRHYHKRSRSRERSKDDSKKATSSGQIKLPISFSSTTNSVGTSKSTDDQLKLKMQLALKAAANADALLREQGILTTKPKEWGRYADQKEQVESKWPKEPALSHKEQLDRVKALDDINAAGFQQQAFLSGAPTIPQVKAKENETILDSHDSAMFGIADPNAIPPSAVKTQLNIKGACVAHENLFMNIAEKEEKWIRKLSLMRQRKLNGEAMF